MRDFQSTIKARTHHAAGLFTLRCEGPELARLVEPGRFAMVGIEGYSRPYLRRAFSFADADPARGEVEFLVKTVGVGTRCLEELPAGSKISILAPLGNAFTVEDLSAGDRVAIVAGGVGVAPFPLLLRELARRQVVADLYFGGRTSADLAYREKISHLVNGREIDSTDDGSFGRRGRVTESLAQAVGEGARYRRVFACGPTPMFRTLAGVVAELGLAAEFSTEAPMGCGFGVCLACVLPRPGGGYLVSCQEGPILPPERVAWEAF